MVHGLARGALCGHELAFTILASGDGLLSSISDRVRVIRGGIPAMKFLRVLTSGKVVATATATGGLRTREKIIFLVRFSTLCLFRLLSTTLRLRDLNDFMPRAFSRVFHVLCLLLLVLMDA